MAFDIPKHKNILLQILKDIYIDSLDETNLNYLLIWLNLKFLNKDFLKFSIY